MNPVSLVLARLLSRSPRPMRPLVGFIFMGAFIMLLTSIALGVFWACGEPRRGNWEYLGLLMVHGAAAAITFGVAREYVGRSSQLRPYIVSTLTVVAFFGTMFLGGLLTGQPMRFEGPQDVLIFILVLGIFSLCGGLLLRRNPEWRRSA